MYTVHIYIYIHIHTVYISYHTLAGRPTSAKLHISTKSLDESSSKHARGTNWTQDQEDLPKLLQGWNISIEGKHSKVNQQIERSESRSLRSLGRWPTRCDCQYLESGCHRKRNGQTQTCFKGACYGMTLWTPDSAYNVSSSKFPVSAAKMLKPMCAGWCHHCPRMAPLLSWTTPPNPKSSCQLTLDEAVSLFLRFWHNLVNVHGVADLVSKADMRPRFLDSNCEVEFLTSCLC